MFKKQLLLLCSVLSFTACTRSAKDTLPDLTPDVVQTEDALPATMDADSTSDLAKPQLDADVTAPDLTKPDLAASWVQVKGAAQKGPFVIGSTVQLSIIDATTANPTGAVFNTTTVDDSGGFAISVPSNSAVELLVQGFYFNEMTGALSTAPLTLRALAQFGSGTEQASYVNALTQLSYRRARKLIEAGADFASAIAQAEKETRAQIGLPVPKGITAATTLDLLGDDDDNNAYLLALSCVLTKAAYDAAPNNPDAKLQEILSTAALDLESGKLSDALALSITNARKTVDPLRCAASLKSGLKGTAASKTLPNILKSVDFDEDGIADFYDTDADGDGLLAANDPFQFVLTSGQYIVVETSGRVWKLDWAGDPSSPGPTLVGKVPALQAVEQTSYTGLATDGTVWSLAATPPQKLPGLTKVVQVGYIEGSLSCVRSDGTVWRYDGSDGTLEQLTYLTNVDRVWGGDPHHHEFDATEPFLPSNGQVVHKLDDTLWITFGGEPLQQVKGIANAKAAMSNDVWKSFFVLSGDGTLWNVVLDDATKKPTLTSVMTGVAELDPSGFVIKTDHTVWEESFAADAFSATFVLHAGLTATQKVSAYSGSSVGSSWLAVLVDGSLAGAFLHSGITPVYLPR